MKTGRQHKFRRGFTLIEIMVAIAVFMMVIAVIYSTWAIVMKATQVGQQAAAQAQRQRIALRTIEDSLMCIQSFQASQRYYYFNVQNGDTPVLSFASRVPDVFPRNGKFGQFNLRRVTFSLEAGEGGEKNLVLRQNPILMDMDDDEQKNPLILAHDVKKFDIECWDTNQMDWVTEWVDTNSIPPLMRVSLVMGGTVNNGGSTPESTVVRAFSMPSSMMPAAVQRGGAGGPAGGAFGPGGPALPIPGGGRKPQ
ncbi:MAG TPA: prepilin-type N-terminal cleavage/methylation domain-containing protein [Candidatus Acidoferrales bacterium]|jgi:prepilin-type N-terminal cleavage/methylation domain-containing protein|nr:prepilin-type N-terminal cleavage/methylation domain-containing protein [Candidatus Acidoferrales bacterium]